MSEIFRRLSFFPENFIRPKFQAKHSYPFPKNADWQHCKGTNSKFRGYTCGLWSNFHAMTVNAFLEDGFSTLDVF